ncbi:hypothetical protein [Deinococcus yavapaiensis]|uniref:Uncharacterized protein n=1 Tax=Deinococcus yavapaiensis KR-236 TaxID=694435 RepID=A0A318SEM8_9DEIO|nr:hypothetical protein [Deinococcus yavapaiensis]PYE54992.1 hypothetical protein DES52_104266 [Deinococcus yavapaiensis KR-236]
MTRLVSSALAVLLIAAFGLFAVWLAGQVLQFLGVLLTSLAVVLARLAWFLLLAAVLGGLAYFLASVYRKS